MKFKQKFAKKCFPLLSGCLNAISQCSHRLVCKLRQGLDALGIPLEGHVRVVHSFHQNPVTHLRGFPLHSTEKKTNKKQNNHTSLNLSECQGTSVSGLRTGACITQNCMFWVPNDGLRKEKAVSTTILSLSPQLKEDIFIYKAKSVMQLVDDTSKNSLLLWLRLLLVT